MLYTYNNSSNFLFFINVKLQLNVNLTIIRLKIGYITPKRKRKESTLVSNDNEDNAQNFISLDRKSVV